VILLNIFFKPETEAKIALPSDRENKKFAQIHGVILKAFNRKEIVL
jgi:hypothetical protein